MAATVNAGRVTLTLAIEVRASTTAGPGHCVERHGADPGCGDEASCEDPVHRE